MDGESHKRREYDSSNHPTGSDMGQPMRHVPGSSIDRFRQQQSSVPRPTGPENPIQQPSDRSHHLSAYGGFEYAESSSYNAPSFQSGGTLQGGNVQYQPDFAAPASSRQHPSQATQQHHEQQGQQHHRVPYDASMVYNLAPQAQPQAPYDGNSSYPPRHSPAIQVLATQFGVPQYFGADEPAGAGVSGQYLTSQVQTAPYSQPPSAVRSTTASAYSEAMPGLTHTVTSEPLQPQEIQRETSNVDDGYQRYQQTLRQTFEYTRAGQLIEASNSLLEISEWLLGNVVQLGLDRDDQNLHAERIKLWSEFNLCWLALCQKQKEMTQQMLEWGGQLENALTADTLKKMGEELVRLCDRLEQYGLVDYEMGVWEEEILCVLCQCLDLLAQNGGSRPSSSRHGDTESSRR
ncbi:hypothetical protein VTO42DRAFT_3592 [Malbranchea cinnamomea]